MVDVLGWRIDDTVALIRGAPDSVVRARRAPGRSRDRRQAQARAARPQDDQPGGAGGEGAPSRRCVDGKTTRRIGVLSRCPRSTRTSRRGRKASRTTRARRATWRACWPDFKKEKVDGVLIDLRNNGGGSLTEAIDLTGLFIDKGPVVQQRNARGEIAVESDTARRRRVGRPARRADQPRLGIGVGDLRRGDPGLRPRPHHRRAELRQGHRADA